MLDKSTMQLILDRQAEFQKRFGFDENIELEDRVRLIHTHSMFLIEETFEMLRELPYHKPWKNYDNLTAAEVEVAFELARKEWIDKLHFMMNIAVFLGFDEEQIRKEYLEKNGINIKRQEDPALGYIKG